MTESNERYSEQEALDEAEKLKELIEKGKATTYEEAHNWYNFRHGRAGKSERGIDEDYYNDFFYLDHLRAGKLGDFDPEKVSNRIKEQPVKKYMERYQDRALRDKSREVIHELDEIVDYINTSWVEPKNVTKEDMNRVLDKAKELIYGREKLERIRRLS